MPRDTAVVAVRLFRTVPLGFTFNNTQETGEDASHKAEALHLQQPSWPERPPMHSYRPGRDQQVGISSLTMILKHLLFSFFFPSVNIKEKDKTKKLIKSQKR